MARIGFRQFSRQQVNIRVKFSVAVHIGVYFKKGPGQLVFRVVSVRLSGFYRTPDNLVLNGDFNGFPIFRDLRREAFLV